jgi:hypothetical protein
LINHQDHQVNLFQKNKNRIKKKFSFVVSNSSIQRVRVSVSSSSHQNEFIQKSKSKSPNYSSVIENFVKENHNKQEKSFDRRPLLDLINEMNQSESLNRNKKIILPPKQISPFKPIILHKKYQVSFIQNNFI